MVRTTKKALSRITQGSWAQRLADFTVKQRVTLHTATGHSLSKLLMGALYHAGPAAPDRSSQLAGALPTPCTSQPDDAVSVQDYRAHTCCDFQRYWFNLLLDCSSGRQCESPVHGPALLSQQHSHGVRARGPACVKPLSGWQNEQQQDTSF